MSSRLTVHFEWYLIKYFQVNSASAVVLLYCLKFLPSPLAVYTFLLIFIVYDAYRSVKLTEISNMQSSVCHF